MADRSLKALLLALLASVIASGHQVAAQDRLLQRSEVADRPSRRVAPVVGVDTSTAATPLKNARNVWRAMKTVLEELQFTVALVEDPTLTELRRALVRFGEGLRTDDLALFSFAGHGLQYAQENYLLSRDYSAESVDDLLWAGR